MGQYTITGCCCGETVLTGCCADPISTTLTATVTNGGIFNGSYTLTYTNVGAARWENVVTEWGTCTLLVEYGLRLSCQPGAPDDYWQLDVQGETGGEFPPASLDCDPLEIVFTGVNMTACGGEANATVTITE